MYRALLINACRHDSCKRSGEVNAMKSNVVLLDRTVRMGLGMLLLASPLLEFHTYPLNLLGLVLIGTAAVGFCPLYAALSVFIAPRRQSDQNQLDAGSRA